MREIPFCHALLLALGGGSGLRVWRQNAGRVAIRDALGHIDRYVDFGPPKGAGDLSGIVIPEGWRLEIETKVEGRQRTAEQIAWGDMIASGGGVYVLCEARKGENTKDAVARCAEQVRAKIEERRQQ